MQLFRKTTRGITVIFKAGFQVYLYLLQRHSLSWDIKLSKISYFLNKIFDYGKLCQEAELICEKIILYNQSNKEINKHTFRGLTRSYLILQNTKQCECPQAEKLHGPALSTTLGAGEGVDNREEGSGLTAIMHPVGREKEKINQVSSMTQKSKFPTIPGI